MPIPHVRMTSIVLEKPIIKQPLTWMGHRGEMLNCSSRYKVLSYEKEPHQRFTIELTTNRM